MIRIGFWAYLRTMLLILWVAFRYPTRTTHIDMETGQWWNEP